MDNFIILPTLDGEWGEVHDYVLKDAVTNARWELEEFGGQLAMRNIPKLDELIESKSWRAKDAANIKAIIIRDALAEIVTERQGELQR